MNFNSSSLSAKEANMFGYEFRVNFTDETFEVTTVIANSISEAAEIASRDPEVESVVCLGSIDREPQVFLAW